MQLIGLRCGGLSTDVGALLGQAPRGFREEIPLMCFAVDTGDGVLVFDTGLHRSCCEPTGARDRYGVLLDVFEPVCPRTALVDERLRQAGYAVDDVRWVTNSHLHFDHTGGNDLFPAATQLVRARELAYARGRMHRPSGFVPADVDVMATAAEWDYDERHELAPGVALLDAPGHTPGHQALDVTFPDGRRFVCFGDAAYTLEAVMAATPTGRSADHDLAVATLAMLRDARNAGAEILSGHDIEQWREVTDLVLLHAG